MRQCRERIGACGVTLGAGADDRRSDRKTGTGPSNHAGFAVKCRQNFRQVSPESPSSVARFCILREQVPILVAADRGGEALSHTLPALNAKSVKEVLEPVSPQMPCWSPTPTAAARQST